MDDMESIDQHITPYKIRSEMNPLRVIIEEERIIKRQAVLGRGMEASELESFKKSTHCEAPAYKVKVRGLKR